MSIRFGTDGWRAVIGEDFTPENIAVLIQAFADIYPTLPEFGKPVVVGFDRRNQSRESAELVSSVLLANNMTTYLVQEYCPTPCVSWMVKTLGAACGVMVTASHNPPKWNGIKFKEAYGGAASGNYLEPIENQIEANFRQGKKPKMAPLENNKRLHRFNPQKEYLENLRGLVNIRGIQKANFKILFDPLYGAGSGYLEKLLGAQVTTLHGQSDPNFGGLHPEPIQPYVNEAMEKMQGGDFSVCLITDGDADRIGAVDENGQIVSAHEIFALLIQHLVEARKLSGKVLKSISTTVMIDRLCKKYSLPLSVTKIGFKYLSPAMKGEGVLIGGEESGGIGMPHHICERDGLYCGLLLLEMMASRGKKLGELVADLQREFGPCFYKRIDLKLPKDRIEKAKLMLAGWNPSSISGQKYRKRTLIDGYHFAMEDDSWLLIRPSGTEPLLRIYAEAPSMEQVDSLLGQAGTLISG